MIFKRNASKQKEHSAKSNPFWKDDEKFILGEKAYYATLSVMASGIIYLMCAHGLSPPQHSQKEEHEYVRTQAWKNSVVIKDTTKTKVYSIPDENSEAIDLGQKEMADSVHQEISIGTLEDSLHVKFGYYRKK